MAIYTGTPTVPPFGGYARPNNPAGKTISGRQHHSLHNPTAKKMQLAMKTAAALFQAMSGPERLTWYQWNWGQFIHRNGDLGSMPTYRGFLAHTHTQHFLDFPVMSGDFIPGIDMIETYNGFTWHYPSQTLYSIWDNWGEQRGDLFSGVSVYQINPAYITSDEPLRHTKLLGSHTPWFTGENPDILETTLHWPVDHPSQIRTLNRYWDNHTMNAGIDTWSGPNMGDDPGYPEICEGGAELSIESLTLPACGGGFWGRQDRFGEACWSRPEDAPFDSGCWIFKPDTHWQIWLERPWAQDALWQGSTYSHLGYYQPVGLSAVGTALVIKM